MSKTNLKEAARERQNNASDVSGAPLPDDNSLIDTHRPVSRVEGGDYTPDNTKVLLPTEHRDLHGNTPRIDDPALVDLRAIMEDYRRCMKLRMMVNNQKLAVERHMDEITPEIEEMYDIILEEIGTRENYFKRAGVKQLDKVDLPIVKAMLEIRGVGPITAAEIVTKIDINLAETPSSLWAYVGLDGESRDRYTKGVKGGGNKHLRSVLYNLATSFMRNGNEDYRAVYDRRKRKTENSKKTVMHKHRAHEPYKETAWKDVNPGRRHNDALRIMIKHFLSDLWFVWRKLEGLPTERPYVEEHLGHSGIISPEERGWKY
jgi:hypothetical protein